MHGDPYLSIIVPLFNEEESVDLLVERVAAVCLRLPYRCEILLVDDGSLDTTFARARALTERYHNLVLLRFRRNFGQTAAMVAGMQRGRGEILLTMDGDLQNDPEDIPAFVRKIEEGYPLVFGWRADRKDRLITRKIPSRVANWLIGKVTGVPVRDNGCSLKAYRAELIRQVPLYSEMHRFIPALTSMVTANYCEIEVRHHPRTAGTSKYGLNRIFKVSIDLIGVQALLAATRSPIFFFIVPAMVAALIAAPTLVTAFRAPSLSLLAAGLLWSACSLILASFAVLSELLVSTSSIPGRNLVLLSEQRQGNVGR